MQASFSYKFFASVTGIVMIALILLGWYWSQEPDLFEPVTAGAEKNKTGFVTTDTISRMIDTLLHKPGGYLSNDVTPPAIWLDNIPAWEFGVLVQLRDIARVLRNDFSRSQSQSVEDRDLSSAEPLLHFDHNSWIFPSTEGEYEKANEFIKSYRSRLIDNNEQDAQFYARADNLVAWLGQVEKRLGSLSQRLSASVGQLRINTDLAGDAEATQATPRPSELVVKTPWLELDDVFYEVRGTSWALIHLLKAVEHDFRSVLLKKNALISLRQIIRELEATQESIWSLFILNGSGFGMFANHSLVMASYISRANASIIDLKQLLQQG